MHTEPFQFVTDLKTKYPSYFTSTKVLEVGSLDINGSVRGFFNNCQYTGLDVGPGKGVDIVCPIHEFIQPLVYDVVISTEMLEHDRHWKESLKQMFLNLKNGGILIFTCAGPTRQEHGTTRTLPQDAPFTNDWYRNISIEDFQSILPVSFWSTMDIYYLRGQADLMFYGIKK